MRDKYRAETQCGIYRADRDTVRDIYRAETQCGIYRADRDTVQDKYRAEISCRDLHEPCSINSPYYGIHF